MYRILYNSPSVLYSRTSFGFWHSSSTNEETGTTKSPEEIEAEIEKANKRLEEKYQRDPSSRPILRVVKDDISTNPDVMEAYKEFQKELDAKPALKSTLSGTFNTISSISSSVVNTIKGTSSRAIKGAKSLEQETEKLSTGPIASIGSLFRGAGRSISSMFDIGNPIPKVDPHDNASITTPPPNNTFWDSNLASFDHIHNQTTRPLRPALFDPVEYHKQIATLDPEIHAIPVLPKTNSESHSIIFSPPSSYKEKFRHLLRNSAASSPIEILSTILSLPKRTWDALSFGETEKGRTHAQIMDILKTNKFSFEEFLINIAAEQIPNVLYASSRGNADVLQRYCTPDLAGIIIQQSQDLIKEGLTLHFELLDIKNIDLSDTSIVDGAPQITVRFLVDQYAYIHDKEGNLVEGDDRASERKIYIWVFRLVPPSLSSSRNQETNEIDEDDPVLVDHVMDLPPHWFISTILSQPEDNMG